MFELPNDAAHSNPNVAALETAYRRWSDTRGGSAPEVLELFADEIEMRSVLDPEVPGELGGTHRSRAEAAEYFAALSRDWEMLYYDVDRFIAEGDEVVMVGRCGYRNKTTGREVHTPKVDLWHFENGRATRFSEYYDTLGLATAAEAAELV
jgi:ketosteroid isomerase-like protein